MMKVDQHSMDDKAESEPKSRFQHALESRRHGLTMLSAIDVWKSLREGRITP